jgi:hypothetical protein
MASKTHVSNGSYHVGKHGLKHFTFMCMCTTRFMLKLEGSVGSHMNCHFVSPETNNVIQSAIPQNEWVIHELSFCESEN